MAWEPTNANDVRLTVSRVERDDSGSVTNTVSVAESASVVVDEFSIDTTKDQTLLHGISNYEALGRSLGNIEHEFSFTVMGEDYAILSEISETIDGNGPPSELQITVQYQGYRTVLTGAGIGEVGDTVSDGEAAEHEFAGMARKRRDKQGGA